MKKSCFSRCGVGRILGWFQISMGALGIVLSGFIVWRLQTAGYLLSDEEACLRFYGTRAPNEGIDIEAQTARFEEVLRQMESLVNKLELKEEVIGPISDARSAFPKIWLRRTADGGNQTVVQESLSSSFMVEEMRKYITHEL